MGNRKSRAVYEANIPKNFWRPKTVALMENFIRQKYELKKYLASDLVQILPPDIPIRLEEADPYVLEKVELPAHSGDSRLNPAASNLRVESKANETATPDLTVSIRPPTSIATASSSTADLLIVSTSPSPHPPFITQSAAYLHVNSRLSASLVSANSAASIPNIQVR